jgi:surface protein
MFVGALAFDANLSLWDMTRFVSLQHTFSGASSFTGRGLEKWSVAAVTYMTSLFRNAGQFNTDLSNWNVENVILLDNMFNGEFSFTGTGLSEWAVHNVLDMSFMCTNCTNFDSDLSKWNVSQVQNMGCVFADTTSFKGIGLEYWRLRDDVILDQMFCGADAFDSTIIRIWNISSSNIYC